MIYLKRMSEKAFQKFKTDSQQSFAVDLAKSLDVSFEAALQNASEQFSRLVPQGLDTKGQMFFDALEKQSDQSIGYLWIGVQQRLGKQVASINDIKVDELQRGKGYGKELMRLALGEARKAGAKTIRLHVFNQNEAAKHLYLSMGFEITSWDMKKDL